MTPQYGCYTLGAETELAQLLDSRMDPQYIYRCKCKT
jgi:hypothetical protein